MRFYADKALEVTDRIVNVFQHLEHQTWYHIEWVTQVKKAATADEHVARVKWQGLDEEESTWESDIA